VHDRHHDRADGDPEHGGAARVDQPAADAAADRAEPVVDVFLEVMNRVIGP
jgi:hypothetical protein